MKRILTLALLAATTLPIPAFAQSPSSSFDSTASTGFQKNNGAFSGKVGMDAGAMSYQARRNAELRENINAQLNENVAPLMSDTAVAAIEPAAGDATTLSPAHIRQIQQALHQKGFLKGKSDGIWGPRTANALRQYQAREQLNATGALDTQTQNKLGVQVR